MRANVGHRDLRMQSGRDVSATACPQ